MSGEFIKAAETQMTTQNDAKNKISISGFP